MLSTVNVMSFINNNFGTNTDPNNDDYDPFPAPPLIPPGHEGGVYAPTSSDVLCGRGRLIHTHVGNIRYRYIIQRDKPRYLARTTSKLEKAHMVADLVTEIRASGGRFLVFNSSIGLWMDTGDEKARRKVGQALRENAPELRQEKLQQQQQCSTTTPTISVQQQRATPILATTQQQQQRHASSPISDVNTNTTSNENDEVIRKELRHKLLRQRSNSACSDISKCHIERRGSTTSVDSMIVEALLTSEALLIPESQSQNNSNSINTSQQVAIQPPHPNNFSYQRLEAQRICSKRSHSSLMRDSAAANNNTINVGEMDNTTRTSSWRRRQQAPPNIKPVFTGEIAAVDATKSSFPTHTPSLLQLNSSDVDNNYDNRLMPITAAATTASSNAPSYGNFSYWTSLLDETETKMRITARPTAVGSKMFPEANQYGTGAGNDQSNHYHQLMNSTTAGQLPLPSSSRSSSGDVSFESIVSALQIDIARNTDDRILDSYVMTEPSSIGQTKTNDAPPAKAA